MIFSMSSDLKTKEIVWTMRQNDDTRMHPHPLGVSSVAYAGQFAWCFRDENQAPVID